MTLKKQAEDALRAPEGPDLGPMTREERHRHLFPSEKLENARTFYGIADLIICARCNGSSYLRDSRCNHCIGAGVTHPNGEPVDE